jgi:hypothetical protein
MVVQETDRRESEVTEEVWEADGAVATGDAAEADGPNATPRGVEWSEYEALHTFEGQQGEVSQRGQSAPLAAPPPQLGSYASAGRAWRLWAARHSRVRPSRGGPSHCLGCSSRPPPTPPMPPPFTLQVSMTRGERLLVSSEEAPEGWILAARAAEPAVIGYVPLTYVQKLPSVTGFVEQERAHARRQEAERAEAAAAAVYTQTKTKKGLQSAGQAVINIVKASKGQAQAFAPDDLDLATTQMREEYAKVGPAYPDE